jgi:DegV family protein with EDD domain
MNVKLVTDSTCYIDENTLKELDIKTVHLTVNFPDESFDETSVPYDYFYKKIENSNTIPTSSQPTLAEIYNTFKEIVSRGEAVLGVFLSSKMSGTYTTALSAKHMILEKYPNAIINILDSKTNCMAMGIQVVEGAMMAKAGKKMEEVIQTVEHVSKRVQFLFVPSSLQYLIKGGRIGGASALIGSLLQIRPILYVNDGMTDVMGRIRGTRKAINHMLNILNEDAKNYGLKHLLVHHIHDSNQGKELAEKLTAQYNRIVPSLPVGPVIGAHVGPGTVGIVYSTNK